MTWVTMVELMYDLGLQSSESACHVMLTIGHSILVLSCLPQASICICACVMMYAVARHW